MSRHHARMPSRRWERVRRRVLERDGWRCRRCGKAGRLEVDHVVPVEAGGDPWDPSNLQTLCRGCHIAKSRAEGTQPESPERAAWRQVLENPPNLDRSGP